MGHARYRDLRDLESVLDEIRRLPGIAEPTPGIFYLRRVPFLHFHTKDIARWADAKVGPSWGPELLIPFGCGRREKARFLREVRARYMSCCSASAVSAPRVERTRRRSTRRRPAARAGRETGW
jgi:hypothetical protein